MSLAIARIRSAILATSIGGCALAFAPGNASAFAHDWHFTEVYSNADGSVQFIEVATATSGETLLSLASVGETAFGHSLALGQDLAQDTAGHSLLLATPGFASLPGAVQPDFVLPVSFFNQNGDTLQWITSSFDPYGGGPIVWDTFTFAAGALPSNGTSSLNRALGSTEQFTAVNSPRNFAGQTGSLVPEPSAALLLALALFGLAARQRIASA